MLSAMVSEFTDSSLTVCCAAVSDYKPVSQAEHKIKKSDEGDSLTISLEKTPDILSTLGTLKSDKNHLVGFALETRDGESYAKQKLIKKNASAIVLNTLGKQGVGFETDTNEVSVYTASGKTFSFPLTSKIALGKSLLELFMSEFNLSDA
jgi:phosphopantothenoylcysteine decarboxylase/phosphopantothenate--cysteine ligase